MGQQNRPENEVFADLADLCRQPGYIHALAHICFRDNVILYKGKIKEADMRKMYSPSRLIRTEINTLLGLMIKSEIDWNVADPAETQRYIDTTDKLLEELHNCLNQEPLAELTKVISEGKSHNPFTRGTTLREPIFYGGEAAYHFQYLDLAVRKYSADSPWILKYRGFTIEQAARIAKVLEEIHSDNLHEIRDRLRTQHPNDWTMLPLFSCTAEQLAERAQLPTEIVEKILCAFTLPPGERNNGFNALNDFNVISATPLLQMPTGAFISLQSYAFAEAIYETPFYWMAQDKSYLGTLSKHRGEFTEGFVAERLRLVFGENNVYLNIDVIEKRSEKLSEIDALVVWGNRIVIVQTKSKRLTIESRKGNDQVIRDDFVKAVQDAYDQGAVCAKSLLAKRGKLVTQDGKEITLAYDIKEIYLFCVVSDNYPALSFQTRQFLKTEDIEKVPSALVMDVFAVDAMTEMLQSPLQFLSYVNRRAKYSNQLMASQELTILGFHLSKNLWVQPDVSLMQLHDDFSTGLDIAMAARRTALNGATTPDGVLTRFGNTTIGRIVKEIEERADPATIDLGFLFLSMSEHAVKEMSQVVDRLAARSRTDGRLHDATFGFQGSGITFQCTEESANVAGPRLNSYCELRKYKEKAGEWFGLCINPRNVEVRFGVSLSYPWSQNDEMDEKTKDMKAPEPIDKIVKSFLQGRNKTKKIGRNDPCPCGSGRKYKKCCLKT